MANTVKLVDSTDPDIIFLVKNLIELTKLEKITWKKESMAERSPNGKRETEYSTWFNYSGCDTNTLLIKFVIRSNQSTVSQSIRVFDTGVELYYEHTYKGTQEYKMWDDDEHNEIHWLLNKLRVAIDDYEKIFDSHKESILRNNIRLAVEYMSK